MNRKLLLTLLTAGLVIAMAAVVFASGDRDGRDDWDEDSSGHGSDDD